METALSEITLVVFTSFAPAGSFGFIMMAIAAVFATERSRAERISHYLVVPLSLSIFGLIASATHLGTPANALYVVSGIGRSPLSNEVVAAVAFLTIGGIYWISSFRDDASPLVRRVWLSAAIVMALVFVGFISVAYSVPSVPTWNTPLTPVTLWFCALSSGPVVGLLGMAMSGERVGKSGSLLVIGLVFAAVIASVILLSAEWHGIKPLATTVARVVEIAPFFPATIALYGMLNLLALAVIWHSLRKADEARIAYLVIASVCAIAACFVVRFAFYSVHMTVGL